MNVPLKDMPSDLHQRIREHAEQSGRSLNKQILYTLEQAMQLQRVDQGALLKRIRLRRASMPSWLEDDTLQAAIREGRG